jgi:hypothetical protein
MPGSPLTLVNVDTHSATPPTVIRTPPSATSAPRGSASVPAIPPPPYQPGASANPAACATSAEAPPAARVGSSEHEAAQAQVATRPANVTARMVRGVLNVWRSAGATQAMPFVCMPVVKRPPENPGKHFRNCKIRDCFCFTQCGGEGEEDGG